MSAKNTQTYSVTSEVFWNVKIKSGHVPDTLLSRGIFRPGFKDCEGDDCFELCESPQYPVTLDQDIKEMVGIPVEADQFSLIYPVDARVLSRTVITDAGPDAERAKRDLILLTVGAFVYWKGTSAFPALAIRPLALADVGLAFSAARDLSVLDPTGRIRQALSWHTVTLQPLRELGVDAFTWINPNRPDLLPHLDYFAVRADRDMFLPEPGKINLSNVHAIESHRSRKQVAPVNCSQGSLQVKDEKGTRANPSAVYRLCKYNLRDSRNGHFYQFAEHGAFAYRMSDGSVRYFDVLDSFVRPMVFDMAEGLSFAHNAQYRRACGALSDAVGKYHGAEGDAKWHRLARALDALGVYEKVLRDHYATQVEDVAKLDASQITRVVAARSEELAKLDDFLKVPPSVRLRELGPIGLRNCSWRAEHFEPFTPADATPEESIQATRELVTSFTEVVVTLRALPESMQELSVLEGEPLVTSLSPINRITLPHLSCIRAGIPLAASYFAFLYPFHDPRVDAALASSAFVAPKHENDLSMLTVGAFVYLDERGRIVDEGVKTLKFGLEGLRFAGARNLESFVEATQKLGMARNQVAASDEGPLQRLERQGRWHSVTAPGLKNLGASHFLWMPPTGGESMASFRAKDLSLADPSSGEPYVLGRHGLFAYKMGSGVTYFDIVPDPSAALYAQLEELEGFQGLSDMISKLKKRLLGVVHGKEAAVGSGQLSKCIQAETGKTPAAVSRMLAEYVRAISDLQTDSCIVCFEPYSKERPRSTWRVCKHTTCASCMQKLSKCPQCNGAPSPKVADGWLQMLDDPESLASQLEALDVNLGELWWN